MGYPESKYHKQETAKEYTKVYTLEQSDNVLLKHEDGMLGYISAGQFATTGSNEFTENQFISGNLTITGDITAHNFITASTEYYTGSTSHGSNINDTHLFTGSVKITGSLNTIGNSTITGSFLVSGSTTQIGNNTLLGNTILSGSVGISGSTFIEGNTTIKGMLFVSGTTNFQNHTITMTGSMYTSGSQIITGSLDIKGNVNVASGSDFYLHGNKLFNYGAFSSTITQSGSADTAHSMSFNTTDIGGHGVSIVNGTRMTVANTGLYNLQFSAQLDRTTTGTNIATIWFAYTGSNVANSATDVIIAGSAASNPIVAAWNYILSMTSGSYVEIYWSHDDNVDNKVELKAVTSRINPTRPAVPSVIATLTQIA